MKSVGSFPGASTLQRTDGDGRKLIPDSAPSPFRKIREKKITLKI